MSSQKLSKPRPFLTYDEMEWTFFANQIAAIKNGRIRTKPKLYVEDKTGKLFRLITPQDGKSYYEELPLESETIYILQLTPEARLRYKSEPLEPLDPPFSIATFSYNAPNFGYPSVSLRQLHSITNALGRPYSWAPMEQSCGYSRNLPHIVNVLFDANKIIGGHAWGMRRKIVHGTFLMISPEYRGRGLGKYLFDFTVQQNLAMGAKFIPLSTSSQCTNSQKVCVISHYRQWGWEVTRRIKFDYDLYKKRKSNIVPLNVPAEYFLDPKTGEDLPRFQKERLERQLAKVSAELLSIAGPKMPSNVANTANATYMAATLG